MRIVIVNGPNLNLLGRREPEVYGREPFSLCLERLAARFPQVEFAYFQSNIEGELINVMQEEGFGRADGIVLNAGAFSHTSIALRDCVAALTVSVVEVHISNVHAREDFRHRLVIAPVCKGVVAGFGFDSYRLAVEALLVSNE